MTFNRCAYPPCSALLHRDGPSPWWCQETCMTAANARRSRK